VTTSEILDGFRQLRVLVAGDVCLDRWCRYDPALALPSRETGIPRIGVVATEVTPGAAGTVASNVAALGAGEVAVLGLAGDDGFGYELRGALAARGISDEYLLDAPSVPTFTYTKLINARTDVEDLPRIDFALAADQGSGGVEFGQVLAQGMLEDVQPHDRVDIWAKVANANAVRICDQPGRDETAILLPSLYVVIARACW